MQKAESGGFCARNKNSQTKQHKLVVPSLTIQYKDEEDAYVAGLGPDSNKEAKVSTTTAVCCPSEQNLNPNMSTLLLH